MSKKTAVEYLFEKLWDRPKDKMVWFYIFEKAKKMEKEQIKDAFDSGVWQNGYFLKNYTSEEYYIETYESE